MTSSAIALPLGLASSSAPGGEAGLPRDAERAAVAASRRGEREAFDLLVARYQRPIYRLCYRYVNNHEDANDLAQDAFLVRRPRAEGAQAMAQGFDVDSAHECEWECK